MTLPTVSETSTFPLVTIDIMFPTVNIPITALYTATRRRYAFIHVRIQHISHAECNTEMSEQVNVAKQMLTYSFK